MFNIHINLENESSSIESEKNLEDLRKFVSLQTKTEYPIIFMKKYLKKELGIGDTRAFEKEVLASFEGDELDEKYEWLHSLRV